MVFKNSNNSTDQGDVGEARAIYEFVKLGYVVSKPINDKAKYDLIVDDGNALKKVQVKTSRHQTSESRYAVNITTVYSNKNNTNIRKRENSDYDILFILTEDGNAWIIPTSDITARSEITVGTGKYNKYKIGE